MSSSPYLSQELKDYMKQNNIEETLSKIVNQLLRGKYSDPYAFMMNEFGKLAKNDITILSVVPYQVLNLNSLPSIKLQYTIEYKQKEYKIETSFQFGQASETVVPLYDNVNEVDSGKGVLNALELIKNKINPILNKKSARDQKQIDEQLVQLYEANEKKGINAIQTISYSLNQVIAQIEKIQPYEVIRQLSGFEGEFQNPKIMVNLLQGSKLVGVKCKIYKFLLIVEKYENGKQLLDIVSQITGNIKKTITSGKLGEAALKYHTDGTFIVTVDSINDNMKMIEEAINKTPYKDNVYVGLNLMADNLYLPDKKLYELENPKQLMDPVQLADFLLKLCTDKPIIKYIQDPIKNDDLEGWSKFMAKFQGKNIQIASSFLYSTINKIKETSLESDKDSNPQMSENEINAANAKKFDLHCAHYRPFEYPTLSSFLEVAKMSINKKNSTAVIIQENLEEFTDTTIVDLAFGLKNCWLNLVSPFKLERLLKYNRIIEILELEKIKHDSN
ncbi:hypothetical protein ABPG74_018778 [Tetrahymena malaccensis]